MFRTKVLLGLALLWPLAAADLVSHSRQGNLVVLKLSEGSAELEWVNSSTFRFRQTSKPLEAATAPREREPVSITLRDATDRLEINSSELKVDIEKAGLKLHVRTAGGLSLLTDLGGARWENGAIVVERRCWPGERFYGLGPRADSRIDARGAIVAAAKPFLISTRGYGLDHVAPGAYTFDLGSTDPQRCRITARDAGRWEFYFYSGLTLKEIFEQRLAAVGPVARLKLNQADVLRPGMLPEDATRLPAWRSLQDLVRSLIHASLSAVLLPAVDLAAYRPAEPWLDRRLSQLAALVPVLYDSDLAAGAALHPEGWKLRRLLTPFLLTYAQEAHDRGFPLIHPLPMQFPSDPEASRHNDEFLFGDEILVAPITTSDGRRRVYFPMGRWTRLKTDQVYGGRETVEIAAAEDELPMFVKNGSIVPLAPEKPGAPMAAHYFPRLGGEFFLSEDGLWDPTQLHAAPASDFLRLEIESKKDRDYEWVVHHSDEPREVVEASKIYWRVVTRDGQKPGCWFYDAEARSLHVMVRAGAGKDHIINIAF